MTEVTRNFCWHQNFVSWGLYAPCPQGYIHERIKSWEKLYKIRLQIDFFETCNKWVMWWGLSVDIKILSPGTSPGLYTCIKSWINCVKSDWRHFLYLQQMKEVTRHFCWHQKFVPWELSTYPRELLHVWKSWKNCIKSDFKETSLKLATNDRSDQMFLLFKFRPQGVVSPYPGAIYICTKSWKKLYKIRLQRDFYETCSKWPVTRGFCWHQNFVHWGYLPLTCGYIHLLNHEKMCIKSEVEEIFLNLMRLSFWHQNFGPNELFSNGYFLNNRWF